LRQALGDAGVALHTVHPVMPGMEDVFLHLQRERKSQ
jgi:ABC-2 type transport system ATP-binding protein